MGQLKENMPVYGKIVWILLALICFELVMLLLMIPDKGIFHWVTVAVITICVFYLARLVLFLIKELRKRI